MSRLDSFIRRVSAQRDILNDLAIRLDDIPGPIFEFGLGSGRTYDHIRERFPDRRVLVFESVKGLSSRVDPSDLVLGDIRDTASKMPDGCAAMIHTDIETGNRERDAELSNWLPALVARLLRLGGYAASGCALSDHRLVHVSLPPGIPDERYHVVRRISP